MNEESYSVSDIQLAAVNLKKYFGPQIQSLIKAINDASDASSRHAKWLVIATWVLAGATVALVCSTLVLVYVTARG